MLQERRAIPTYVSIFSAYNDVMRQFYNYNGNTMDWSMDPVKEMLLDILKEAVKDYKKNPMDVYAVSTINIFVACLDPVYNLHRGLRSDVHETLRTNFSPDILTEPLIVWKKARWVKIANMPVRQRADVLVKLELPVGARVVRSLFSNKCRTDKAKILAITSLDDSISYQTAYSDYDWDYYYDVGEVVEPHLGIFDDRTWISCSSGIHFFETKEEALEYDFR